MFFKKIKSNILVKAFFKLVQDEGLEYAGYLAYLNIFSLFPLFIILSIIIGTIADNEINARIITMILSYIPTYSTLVNKQIQAIISGPSIEMLSFASIGAVWTTTSSLEGLRTTFNKIYKVKTPHFFIKTRLISILQFFLILIIFIITIFSFIIIPKIFVALESFLHTEIISILNFEKYDLSYVTALCIIFIVVASIYYSFTNKKITFISVLPGSAITTGLWAISAKIMGIYLSLQFKQISLVYGSLSGILIILLFFYVANLILLYGAEFNYILSKKLNTVKF